MTLLEIYILKSKNSLIGITGIKIIFKILRGNNRERNVGWRLDYFVINDKSINAVKSSEINNTILGSDHCPIELELDVSKLWKLFIFF